MFIGTTPRLKRLPALANFPMAEGRCGLLLVTSERQVQTGFELTDDNLDDVVHICRLVEGLPLGILLALAWVGMLSPQEFAGEIGQSLDSLATDVRDVPERQRSMRAVFDYSWNLLTARECKMFHGLSVFRGGFAREAAQRVVGASLRELMGLNSKSLLRQCAGEKLSAEPEAQAVALRSDTSQARRDSTRSEWLVALLSFHGSFPRGKNSRRHGGSSVF